MGNDLRPHRIKKLHCKGSSFVLLPFLLSYFTAPKKKKHSDISESLKEEYPQISQSLKMYLCFVGEKYSAVSATLKRNMPFCIYSSKQAAFVKSAAVIIRTKSRIKHAPFSAVYLPFIFTKINSNP